MCTILYDSAKNTFGVRKRSQNTKKHIRTNKPWFTADCKNARQKYRRTKRLYQKYRTTTLRENRRKTI
jgi:hypothetical protein